MSKECGAQDDEGHDQQNSRIQAPGPRGGKTQCNIQDVEQRQAERDLEVDGIAAMTFGQRPESAGIG
ncbi:MAG: hypothetical protein DMG56_09990 [Acidobacteria bacterium]|nr:MAG: hypothetical protein DMG56_09990 [Acidobacteriota bacterium]